MWNENWESTGREACEEYCWFTEGYSVYVGTASALYCRKASIMITDLVHRLPLFPGISFFRNVQSDQRWRPLVNIIMLAIRQCAAWASTLITQNIPERRKPRKQKKPMHKVYIAIRTLCLLASRLDRCVELDCRSIPITLLLTTDTYTSYLRQHAYPTQGRSNVEMRTFKEFLYLFPPGMAFYVLCTSGRAFNCVITAPYLPVLQS